MQGKKKTAVIIGAGPAGLTAALELLRRSRVVPLVLEKSEHMGGISRTVRYKGNRMDIGGHRFFSKSDRVMKWWLEMMPLEGDGAAGGHFLAYQNRSRSLPSDGRGPDPRKDDRVMLVRERKSRIYFLRRFFEYPLRLSGETLRKLGLLRTMRIGLSYFRSVIKKTKPETTLEQFLINRFGRELYLTFFKSYTEKVWGVPCDRISAEWGAQRIKGLSLTRTLLHAMKKLLPSSSGDLRQKKVETSLIEKFLYPKLGPGQLWEHVAEAVKAEGGSILTGWDVRRVHLDGNRVIGVTAVNERGEETRFEADYVFSTMPIKELVRAVDAPVPAAVREVSEGLLYRDFITVGVLLDRLTLQEDSPKTAGLLRDNWIYIQEPDVRVGRMQVFNNWSPWLVADPQKVWLGLEYFCDEGDDLWTLSDAQMTSLAVEEMERIGIISRADVRDATVVRVPKTYPAYFGTYHRFQELREWVDRLENLFLVGRNGMHKYNNQDHSMLTAMTAVDNILEGRRDKANLWEVNTEMEYHEEKETAAHEGAERTEKRQHAVEGRRSPAVSS